jgi:diaminohydroxyphosphoribosylaminopyrimidine deaminase/5-amino-6-(5-phosphoribosylamino)uracil reductase
LIDAGVACVVVAVRDPDEKVSGRGIDRLREAGIEVHVGDGADEVTQQLAPYLHHRRTGLPYVVLKMGATLDGRTAMADGTSQWITSAEARRDAHELRADSDVIVVGAGTVRSDDPELTARDARERRDPTRIVLGRAPAGAKIHPCREFSGELPELLRDLGREGVVQVMVEGGATVAGNFLDAGLVNRVVTYLAPAVAGSDGGRGMFDRLRTPTMEALRRGRFSEVRLLGSDIRVDLEL